MKRKIADWIYNFWFNNHTHSWHPYEPSFVWERCRKCGARRNTRVKVPEEYFRTK